jgi:mono/diheme cytochrome c family protein
MNARHLAGSTAALALACVTGAALAAGDDATLARGRYMVRISGCNDCHTPGYPESGGNVPEARWLTGSPVGFKGPWGVTYPSNLRLQVASMDEAAWMQHAREPRRPPMPWFSLREMHDDDLRAMYRFIRSLGPAGDPAPAYAPPGAEVRTPWVLFVPQNLPPGAPGK